MKTNHDHSSDNIWGSFIALIYSFLYSCFKHLDGWAIVQSILCAVLGYVAVRLVRKFFPEKKETQNP